MPMRPLQQDTVQILLSGRVRDFISPRHLRPQVPPCVLSIYPFTRLQVPAFNRRRYWNEAPRTRNQQWIRRAKAITPELKKQREELRVSKAALVGAKTANDPVLKSAVDSGHLAVRTSEAADILREFELLPTDASSAVKIPSGSAIAELCRSHGVKPLLLTVLALVLGRARHDKDTTELAKKLVYSASAAGDACATIFLCSNGIKDGNHGKRELYGPRKHLMELAAQGKNSHALVLEGHIAQMDGQVERAIELFKRGVEVGKQSESDRDGIDVLYNTLEVDDPTVSGRLREGYRWLAQLLWDIDDIPGAKEAYREGAEQDDPICLSYMARAENEKNKEWLDYATRAAALGQGDAICALADFYSEMADARKAPVGRLSKFQRMLHRRKKAVTAPIEHLDPTQRGLLAHMWYTVGVLLPHGQSILGAIKYNLKHGGWKEARALVPIFRSCKERDSVSEREALRVIEEWTINGEKAMGKKLE